MDGTVLTFKGSGAMWDYGDGDYNPQSSWGGHWGKSVTEVIWTYGDCNITKIGHSAFIYCNNLTSMHWSNAEKVEGEGKVPGSVTAVSKFGFYHCGMTKMIFESGGKVSFDRYAMSGMSNLEELILNKKSSFQTIYPVVDWCGKLTTLEFNGDAKYGWQTFNGSSKIDTMKIGKDVSSIEGLRTDQNGDLAIKKFIVDPQNATYSLDDGVLLKKSGSDLIVVVAPIDKEYYYMSDDVTKVAHAAFAHSSLKGIHLSNKLTTIEYGAFRWSSNLATVLLPDSCSYVGNGAFIGCTALKKIHFGTGLTTMWAETFEYANISKFDNDGKKVQIDYDGSWMDHQLSGEEIGYLKNMTFTKDGKTMEDTSSRYAVVGYFTNKDTNELYSFKEVKTGSKLSEPSEPTWADHAFDGWYRDSDSWNRQWVFSTDVIDRDVKLYGMWTDDMEVFKYSPYKYPARSWNGVQRALSSVPAADVIELQRDIYAYGKDALTLDSHRYPSNVATIDLNGFTLDRQRTAADTAGYVIKVADGKHLTIKDSGGTGKITGGYGTDGGAIYVDRGVNLIAEVTIDSGTITGNKATNGGAIYINGGIVIINGGTITDNNASYGGAIYNNGGTNNTGRITINHGNISANVANNDGGALYINKGTVTINEGTITGNNALTRCGGAIYINATDSTLNLYGGTITNNIAAADGGAILYGAGTVNVQGTPVVTNNIAPTGMDVMLRADMFLTVTGEMGNGAMIYLTAVDTSQILAKPDQTAID